MFFIEEVIKTDQGYFVGIEETYGTQTKITFVNLHYPFEVKLKPDELCFISNESNKQFTFKFEGEKEKSIDRFVDMYKEAMGENLKRQLTESKQKQTVILQDKSNTSALSQLVDYICARCDGTDYVENKIRYFSYAIKDIQAITIATANDLRIQLANNAVIKIDLEHLTQYTVQDKKPVKLRMGSVYAINDTFKLIRNLTGENCFDDSDLMRGMFGIINIK